MNVPREAIQTWQGWLDAFVQDASSEGLAACMQSNDGELPPEALATLFHLRTLYEEANAMLLACLQLPSPEAERALAAIANAARGAGFAKPPRQLKGRQKDFYRRASRVLLRDFPPEADLLRSIFLHYLHGDYDAQADVNLLLQEARFESARNQRAKALELAGEAGAMMLRSRRFWEGWVYEGEGDFPYWALVLLTLLVEWGAEGLLPLGAVEAERERAQERAGFMAREFARRHEQPLPEDGSQDDFEDDAEPDEAFVSDWI